MLHFLEVIVRRDSAVKSQVSDFRFAILSYVCWFGGRGGGVGEGLVTCHGAAVPWGKGM